MYYRSDNHRSEELAVKLWYVLAPLVVGCGTFGNFVIIAVFSQRKIKKSTTSFLMRYNWSLSVVQTLFLWVIVCLPPGRWGTVGIPGDMFYNRSNGWCKFLALFVQPVVFLYAEALILATLSVDRAVAFSRPDIRQAVFYQANLKVVMICILCATPLFLFPNTEATIYVYENQPERGRSGGGLNRSHAEPVCHLPNHSFIITYGVRFRFIRMLLFEITPQLTMVFALAFTVFKFWRRVAMNRKIRSHHIKLLKLVLANVLGYLLLHTPQEVLYFLSHIVQTSRFNRTPDFIQALSYNKTLDIYLELLTMFHFACSFFLYCLPVQSFREQLRRLWEKQKPI